MQNTRVFNILYPQSTIVVTTESRKSLIKYRFFKKVVWILFPENINYIAERWRENVERIPTASLFDTALQRLESHKIC
jgi:hypothetical protein